MVSDLIMAGTEYPKIDTLYENDAVRVTSISGDGDKIKKIPDGIKIQTESGEFVFFPTKEIIDPVVDNTLRNFFFDVWNKQHEGISKHGSR